MPAQLNTLPFLQMRLHRFPSNPPGREDPQFVPAVLKDCIHSIHLGSAFMSYWRRLAVLLPSSALFVAPGISGAQQHAPIAEQIARVG